MDLSLLGSAGTVRRVPLHPAPSLVRPRTALETREAFAAAHVVPLSYGDNTPGQPAQVDWHATLAFRRHLWSWGLGVADAMDTAQRNMGLDWAATEELIRRSAAEARAEGGAIVVGVNTDHVSEREISLNAVVEAYLHQAAVAEDAGAGIVLMASRHLARAARGAEDYERVYDAVLSQVGAPVILHWLGAAFDAELDGYFGSQDFPTASATVLRIITDHPQAVRGIKMSLLDHAAEVSLRRRLPRGVRMLTGDDYHYVRLIEGDGTHTSDALLGAFAAIAGPASASLQALDAGDLGEYRRILGPTEALAQHIFASPTQYYKTGVAFMSWLSGHQSAFQMVGGLAAGRSLPHLSRIVELANDSGALEKPEVAARRWNALLSINGVDL